MMMAATRAGSMSVLNSASSASSEPRAGVAVAFDGEGQAVDVARHFAEARFVGHDLAGQRHAHEACGRGRRRRS